MSKFILSLISILIVHPCFAEEPIKKKAEYHKVLRVIDGDTLEVQTAAGIQKIRIIGLNTPETKDPRKPVECFGKEASAKAKELVEGKSVQLVSDPTQGDSDKFGRKLRYVVLEDGTNFSEMMIREGFGHEFTYRIPHKYRDNFKAAQDDARKSKRGLWADKACQQSSLEKSKETSKYKCNCNKTCPNLTCDEAYFQLEKCGCSVRDGDSDGVPCEKQCEGQER